MTRYLVTGASGFLGRHLVQNMLARGHEVRALVRYPTLQLERSGAEVLAGDVCDPYACEQAVQGIEGVFHAAGMVSRDRKDAPSMYKIHVEGTKTLLEAAVKASVRRTVVVSSSGTVGVHDTPEGIATEKDGYCEEAVAGWPYYLSKIYQEKLALEFGRRFGMEVVAVLPSLLLGPFDERGSSTTDAKHVIEGKLPLIPSGGGVAFVDVRDAAEGCIRAMEVGQAGERYLLSAANMPLTAYLGRIARLAGVPSPRPWLKPRLAQWAGRVVGGACERLGLDTSIGPESLEMAQRYWYVDAQKARLELDWQPRDPQETLIDTVAYLKGERKFTHFDRAAQRLGA